MKQKIEGGKKEFNNKLAREAQYNYCKEKGYTNFAPATGICWSCRIDIYSEIEQEDFGFMSQEKVKFKTGISVKEAGEHHITGCPHCHRSFCD